MDVKLRTIHKEDKIIGSLPAPVIRKTEIDLHGKTVNEAIPIVEDFLQKSYKVHEPRIWIIHGKGTGVLCEEVRHHLQNHRLVECFAPADKSHGGEGATQVDFKKAWAVS